jgi:hypothetical protein
VGRARKEAERGMGGVSFRRSEIMRPPPVFDDKETAILSAMYNVPNGTFDSYSLTWKLNPTVENGTPPAGVAFAETRGATESLIARSLVSGERLSGNDGVYFTKLKLTSKGVRGAIQAIQQRKDVEESMRALAEIEEQVKSLLPEVPKSTDKK